MPTARWIRIGLLFLVALVSGCAGRTEPALSPLAPQSPLTSVSPLGETPPSPVPPTPAVGRPTLSPAPAVDAAALLRERCAVPRPEPGGAIPQNGRGVEADG